jgi:hypothetical protein
MAGLLDAYDKVPEVSRLPSYDLQSWIRNLDIVSPGRDRWIGSWLNHLRQQF